MRKFLLLMLSVFRCEQLLSVMKKVKSRIRTPLADFGWTVNVKKRK